MQTLFACYCDRGTIFLHSLSSAKQNKNVFVGPHTPYTIVNNHLMYCFKFYEVIHFLILFDTGNMSGEHVGRACRESMSGFLICHVILGGSHQVSLTKMWGSCNVLQVRIRESLSLVFYVRIKKVMSGFLGQRLTFLG